MVRLSSSAMTFPRKVVSLEHPSWVLKIVGVGKFARSPYKKIERIINETYQPKPGAKPGNMKK
jgi:hypothetical protein